jgi:cell division protein FtsZ
MSAQAERIILGESSARGWGSGGNAELGRRFAEDSHEDIRRLVGRCDLLVVTAGLAKGIGAGGSPVVCQVAKEVGVPVVGFFVLPFLLEGEERLQGAQDALRALWQLVDGAVVVSNQLYLEYKRERTDTPPSLFDVFTDIDELLAVFLSSLDTILNEGGIIGLDFADVKSLLMRGKYITVARGIGSGEDRMEQAVEQIKASAGWDSINSGEIHAILLVIQTSSDISIQELEKTVGRLTEKFSDPPPVSCGVYVSKELSGDIAVTALACSSNVPIHMAAGASSTEQQELGLGPHKNDNLDIPTFLRKRHN